MITGRTTAATTVHETSPSRTLHPGEVHLWVVATAPHDGPLAAHVDAGIGPWSDAAAKRQWQATTAAERARAARLRVPGAADRFLVAHGALRLILAALLDSDPLALEFVTDPNGKPTVAEAPLHFNLSHSGTLAAVAVAADRPVGVDIERHRPLADLDALVRRTCSPRERCDLEALGPELRPGAFLALWARKEAYAKWSGGGLRALPHDLALAEAGGCRSLALDDVPGYATAVAAAGADWRLVRRS